MSLLYALCPVPLACFSYYVCPLCKKRNKKAWKVVFLLRWQQRGKRLLMNVEWLLWLHYRSFLYKDSTYKIGKASNLQYYYAMSAVQYFNCQCQFGITFFCILNRKMFYSILTKVIWGDLLHIWQSRSDFFCLSFRVKAKDVVCKENSGKR